MPGYTHGMMTIRIHPKIAQQIAKNAKELGVDQLALIQCVIEQLTDLEFADIWTENLRGSHGDK